MGPWSSWLKVYISVQSQELEREQERGFWVLKQRKALKMLNGMTAFVG